MNSTTNLNFLFRNKIIITVSTICSFILVLSLVFPIEFVERLKIASNLILISFNYFYLYIGLISGLAAILITILPMGKIKLNGDKPEYSFFSWIAMLYSTGMGAGLLLRSVQEPIFYFLNPPIKSTLAPEILSLQYTFFHWGFTAWAFYSIFGLVIQSRMHSNQLKLKFNFPTQILLILLTMVGIISVLSLGSKQIITGINFQGLAEDSLVNHLLIISIIAIFATTSAWLGVHKSIRRISNFNIILAFILMGFIFLFGNKIKILESLFYSTIELIRNFIPMSLNLGTSKASDNFINEWTVFYWAFWLAWTPFTGIFIAKISQGRTVREYLIGSILIPSFASFVWFSIFGTEAFSLIQEFPEQKESFLSIYKSLFTLLSFYPADKITAIISLLAMSTFLLTSIDSAIYVLGILSDQGNLTPRNTLRIYWGIALFSLSSCLVIIGEINLLSSLKDLLILFAFPFSFLYLYYIFRYFIINIKNKEG